MRKSILPLLFSGLLCVEAGAQGKVENIPWDWSAPSALRRIRIHGSTASTCFDINSGNYISARAHDGDRKTKWVASEKPSEQSPQWLELNLAGEQAVSCVSVFGERIGNDGIVDAQIQIASATVPQFHTVASVTGAVSASWRADFPAATASRVRLLVTRSGGPSTHTDVYEVEVYGPKLAAAELKQQAKTRLAEGNALILGLSGRTQWWKNTPSAWLQDPDQLADDLAVRVKKLSASLAEWDRLQSRDQEKLAEDVDSTLEQLRQFQEVIAKLNPYLQPRLAALQKARKIFAHAGDESREQRGENEIRLFNQHVLLQFNPAENSWNAFWNKKSDTALFHAGFAAEAEGKNLKPETVHTEVSAFQDKLGRGKQIERSWGEEIRVEQILRVYDRLGAITVSGRIINRGRHDIALGSVHPLIIAADSHGWWQSGSVVDVPAAVFIVSASEFQCTPGRHAGLGKDDAQAYASSQMLQLAEASSRRGLTAGFLTAEAARPELNAHFVAGAGGTSFSARQSFLNRKLGPGEALDFDALYINAEDDSYQGLEDYADAVARFAGQPVRTAPTALWCSWYAHRMAVDEDLVLANAAVAAKYFKPLGFEIMQLDHGWQRGDITGDWIPDEKSFPHGFKWLARELQSRYGLKLGVWIAPTDVAETSDTFREHPGWMLKDPQGKPRVNWRWYWKPNPNCFELDASNPDASRWIQDTFRRLSAEGVSYFKIDFIASAGGEHFIQQNPRVTRGWSVLRGAMAAVRRGAGANAWIRYCQPPPLLAVGLADSAYGGDDTSDAGLNGDIHVLRSNARSLAASCWLNGRLYRREVCDMSVRMQAEVEETRMRLALMTLGGCSISFSDELQYLPASRLRLMQTCLPPGAPAMKPLDLFERTIPSVWHLHCKNEADEWEVIGLFNFENSPETRTVDFQRLNLGTNVEMAAFEFWEQRFLGVHRQSLSLTLPAQSCRILSLRRISGHPQIVGTDMHQLQGFHELKQAAWDEKASRLSGECERMAGFEGEIFIYVPNNFAPHFEFPLNDNSARLTHLDGNIWAYEISFRNARQAWTIPFDRK